MKRILPFLLFLFLGVALVAFAYAMEDPETEESKEIEEPLHYISQINQAAKEHKIDPFVLAAVARVESSWQETVESPVGARGLMQIMPETGAYLARLREKELSAEDLFDPAVSLDYGAYYLSYLKQKFHDWDVVFAAYNAGPGQVEKWLTEQNGSPEGTLKEIPFEETRNYVKKVNHYLEYYRKSYGTFPTKDRNH